MVRNIFWKRFYFKFMKNLYKRSAEIFYRERGARKFKRHADFYLLVFINGIKINMDWYISYRVNVHLMYENILFADAFYLKRNDRRFSGNAKHFIEFPCF